MSLFSSIPVELFTALASGAVSFLGSIVAMKIKQKAAEQKILMARFQAEEQSRIRAEENNTPDKRWTRRTIALTATVSILVLPVLAGIFGVDVVYGWTELKGGFWPFTRDKSEMVWHVVKGGGVIITPLHTHTLSAIIGFYFGGSVAENARVR